MTAASESALKEPRAGDWLASGVPAISGFIPPGCAASRARTWSTELFQLSSARGHPVRIDGAQLLGERAALTGARARPEEPNVSIGGACRLLPCGDGWVAVSLPRSSDLELVAPMIERPVADPWGELADWLRERPADDVVDRAGLLGIALSRVGDSAAARKPALLPGGGFTPREQPLVVDFSALWAGPLCADLLALAGARVIKVESSRRLDGARRGNRPFFDLLAGGHESVCVDPGSAEDRALLRSLVEAADVVIEASRPRALAGWGLSAADTAAAGAVWVSITAYGRDQPERIGFGDDVAAGAGLVGWIDHTPRFVGDAIADPLTGLAASVYALRQLAAGRGALLDVSMASVAASTLDGSSTTLLAGSRPPAPVARSIGDAARAAGADTGAVRREFG